MLLASAEHPQTFCLLRQGMSLAVAGLAILGGSLALAYLEHRIKGNKQQSPKQDSTPKEQLRLPPGSGTTNPSAGSTTFTARLWRGVATKLRR
jgi:hypothetical protein